MIGLNYDDLITSLDGLNLDYAVVGSAHLGQYAPASLGNIVQNGIYFTKDPNVDLSKIHNSIIITLAAKTGTDNLFIVTEKPQLFYYRFLEKTFSPPRPTGVHSTAIVDPEAVIDPSAYIGPYCIIGKAKIGNHVKLHSNVTVHDNCTIGDNTEIEAYSVIGATGVVWCWDSENARRVTPPQLGSVMIGPDCFLGTSITVVRGSINEATTIGRNTVIAHGTKVGHGTQIGSECHLANNVTIGGNVVIASRSFLGSACTLRAGAILGPKTVVACGAVVVSNFVDGDVTLVGMPAKSVITDKSKRGTGIPDISEM